MSAIKKLYELGQITKDQYIQFTSALQRNVKVTKAPKVARKLPGMKRKEVTVVKKAKPPKEKVFNEKTLRFVNKDGRTGKRVAKRDQQKAREWEDDLELAERINTFEKKRRFGKALKGIDGIEYRKVESEKLMGGIMLHETAVVKDQDVDLVEANIERIMEFVMAFKEDRMFDLVKPKSGFDFTVKLWFTGDGGAVDSVMLRRMDMNPDGIRKKLLAKVGKMHNNEEYTVALRSIQLIVRPLSLFGGCNTKRLHKSRHRINKRDYYNLVSVKSTDNNCLIQCFIYACGLKGNTCKPNAVRKKLGLVRGEKIKFDAVSKVAAFFKRGFILFNECEEVLASSKDEALDPILLMLMDGHYFVIEKKLHTRCGDCAQWYLTSNGHAKCNIDRASFVQYKLGTIAKSIVRTNTKRYKDEEMDYAAVMHVDFETFQDKIRHAVYGAGWQKGDVYKQAYGQGCMDKFMDDLVKCENTTINAYNGSGFDFYFIIDELCKRGVEVCPKNILKNGGKVLSFTFGNGNKFFDLCLFVNSSLDKACKEFNLNVRKTSFDHKKIRSWKDVETYRSEVEPYLKNDVQSLSELFQKFNKTIHGLEGVNIVRFITLSHMAYEMWVGAKGKLHLEIPQDMERYRFIQSSVFAGRVHPLKRNFRSDMLEEVQKGEATYDEVVKSQSYLFAADATSLHPASMAGFELCREVWYPAGKSEWVGGSLEAEKAFREGKLGFYTVTYTPPTDIRVPVLPRRLENGGIRWDLHKHTGVYNSIDIENAEQAGYKIKFSGRALVYPNKCQPFKEFVEKYARVKEEAGREGNEVMYAVAKLIQNSLYGKMLMKPILTHTAIVSSVNEYAKFCRDYDVTDFEVMSPDRILMTGESKEADQEKQIKMPTQLGSFILGYSRRIMLTYMKACDPTLKRPVFYYTDTDSLHIEARDYMRLKELGMIKPKKESSLGYLCSDIKMEGLILAATYLAPKCYAHESINSNNACSRAIKTKAIPKRCLNWQMFEKGEATKVKFSGLKKVHANRTAEQKRAGVSNFSIVNAETTRTWNKAEWKGMELIGNDYYPFGFSH